MKVTINGQLLDFDPKTITKWEIQSGGLESFCFPSIGNTKCFVKRKKGIPFSGIDLLTKLKAIGKLDYFPVIYDIQSQQEVDTEDNQSKVFYYLFSEFIEGDTLEDVITKGNPFDLIKMQTDLYAALTKLHELGFWFCDFAEKNIYYGKQTKQYYLIDLDSCASLQTQPNNESVIFKTYATITESFFIDILKKQGFDLNHIKGDALNLLQLVCFLAKLDYCLLMRKTNAKFRFFDSKNFINLHHFIHEKNEKLSERVFNDFVIKNSILNKEQIKTLITFILGLAQLPNVEIKYFMAHGQDKETTIGLGDEVYLSWEVLYASTVEISGIGTSLAAKDRRKVKPAQDTTYILKATNNQNQVSQKQVKVKVVKKKVINVTENEVVFSIQKVPLKDRIQNLVKIETQIVTKEIFVTKKTNLYKTVSAILTIIIALLGIYIGIIVNATSSLENENQILIQKLKEQRQYMIPDAADTIKASSSIEESKNLKNIILAEFSGSFTGKLKGYYRQLSVSNLEYQPNQSFSFLYSVQGEGTSQKNQQGQGNLQNYTISFATLGSGKIIKKSNGYELIANDSTWQFFKPISL